MKKYCEPNDIILLSIIMKEIQKNAINTQIKKKNDEIAKELISKKTRKKQNAPCVFSQI